MNILEITDDQQRMWDLLKGFTPIQLAAKAVNERLHEPVEWTWLDDNACYGQTEDNIDVDFYAHPDDPSKITVRFDDNSVPYRENVIGAEAAIKAFESTLEDIRNNQDDYDEEEY